MPKSAWFWRLFRLGEQPLDGTAPMDGLAGERLGRINPEVLADLLKLTPEQRRQMVQQLAANDTSGGTVPVEVAMRAAQIAKASGESLGPA